MNDPDNNLQSSGEKVILALVCDRDKLFRLKMDNITTHTTHNVTVPDPLEVSFLDTDIPSDSTNPRFCYARWRSDYKNLSETEAGCSLSQLQGDNCTNIALAGVRLLVSRNESELPECWQLYNGFGLAGVPLSVVYNGCENITCNLTCQYLNENGHWVSNSGDSSEPEYNNLSCSFWAPVPIEVDTGEPDNSDSIIPNVLTTATAMVLVRLFFQF